MKQTYRIDQNLLGHWIVTDDQRRFYGSYRTRDEAVERVAALYRCDEDGERAQYEERGK